MPKSQFITPAEARTNGGITLAPISVNAGNTTSNKALPARNFTKRAPVRTKRATLDTKASLRDRVLAGLMRRSPYVAIDTIRRELSAQRVRIADSTLLNYLQEFVADGFIHSAGRGWYSILARRLTFDRAPVEPVVSLIKESFPALDFSVWSTQQINPWMHHLLGKFVTFVHVEKEGIGPIWELLRDAGYDTYRNPARREIAATFAVRGQTAVIRPGAPGQSPTDNHYALPEKIFVDLAGEIKKIPLMDMSEFEMMFSNAIQSARLEIPVLLRYSARKMLRAKLLHIINSTLAEIEKI